MASVDPNFEFNCPQYVDFNQSDTDSRASEYFRFDHEQGGMPVTLTPACTPAPSPREQKKTPTTTNTTGQALVNISNLPADTRHSPKPSTTTTYRRALRTEVLQKNHNENTATNKQQEPARPEVQKTTHKDGGGTKQPRPQIKTTAAAKKHRTLTMPVTPNCLKHKKSTSRTKVLPSEELELQKIQQLRKQAARTIHQSKHYALAHATRHVTAAASKHVKHADANQQHAASSSGKTQLFTFTSENKLQRRAAAQERNNAQTKPEPSHVAARRSVAVPSTSTRPPTSGLTTAAGITSTTSATTHRRTATTHNSSATRGHLFGSPAAMRGSKRRRSRALAELCVQSRPPSEKKQRTHSKSAENKPSHRIANRSATQMYGSRSAITKTTNTKVEPTTKPAAAAASVSNATSNARTALPKRTRIESKPPLPTAAAGASHRGGAQPKQKTETKAVSFARSGSRVSHASAGSQKPRTAADTTDGTAAVQRFLAKPMRDAILHGTKSDHTAAASAISQPHRSGAIPHSGVPFMPKLKRIATQPHAFSFETRETNKKLNRHQNVKAQESTAHQDVELPRSRHPSAAASRVKSSMLTRSAVKKQLATSATGTAAQRGKSTTAQQPSQTTSFKARECTVLRKKPFVPIKSTRSITEVSNLTLNTDIRASRRSLWETSRVEKETAQQVERNAERAKQQAEEQQTIARQRLESVHKAQPVRKYKRVLIKNCDKPLTRPTTPVCAKRKPIKKEGALIQIL